MLLVPYSTGKKVEVCRCRYTTLNMLFYVLSQCADLRRILLHDMLCLVLLYSVIHLRSRDREASTIRHQDIDMPIAVEQYPIVDAICSITDIC